MRGDRDEAPDYRNHEPIDYSSNSSNSSNSNNSSEYSSRETAYKEPQESSEIRLNKAHLGNDWFGHHNFFSRLMVIVVIIVFLYSFFIPLPVEYTNIISWVYIAVFMTMLFGINSLRIVVDLIQKIKDRR